MSWEILTIHGSGITHVLPVADDIKHLLTTDCICGPRSSRDDLGLLITHHALDGREHAEPDHDRAHCPVCTHET